MKNLVIEDINRIKELMGVSLIYEDSGLRPRIQINYSSKRPRMTDGQVESLNLYKPKRDANGQDILDRRGKRRIELIKTADDLDLRMRELETKTFDELDIDERAFMKDVNKKLAALDNTYISKLADEYFDQIKDVDIRTKMIADREIHSLLGDDANVTAFKEEMQKLGKLPKTIKPLTKEGADQLLIDAQKRTVTDDEFAQLMDAESRGLLNDKKVEFKRAIDGKLPGSSDVKNMYDEYRQYAKNLKGTKETVKSFEDWMGSTYKLPTAWQNFLGVAWSKIGRPFKIMMDPAVTTTARLTYAISLLLGGGATYFLALYGIPLIKKGKRQIDKGGSYLTAPSQEEIKSALDKYFKYASPKVINGKSYINIYDNKIVSKNMKFRTQTPSFDIFGSGEEQYIILDDGITLGDKKAYKAFKILIPTIEFAGINPISLELLNDVSAETTITSTYTDDLSSFKKYMDDNKIQNSSEATEKTKEDSGMTFNTYVGDGLSYKFCKGTFIPSNEECK